MSAKSLPICALFLFLVLQYGCNKNKCRSDNEHAPARLLLNVVDNSKQLDLHAPSLFWYDNGIKHNLNTGKSDVPPCDIYFQEWLDTVTNTAVIDSARPLIKIAGLWQPINNFSNPSRYYLEYKNHEVDTLDIEFEQRLVQDELNCGAYYKYCWTKVKYKGNYLLVDYPFMSPITGKTSIV